MFVNQYKKKSILQLYKNIKLIVLTFNYMASCRDYNLEFKFNTALVKYFKLITMHEYLDVMVQSSRTTICSLIHPI